MPSIAVTASTDDTILNVNDKVDTWNNIVRVNNADTVSPNTDTTMVFKIARDSSAPNTYTVSRIFMYFDTSSLPDSAYITSGTLHLHATANVPNGHSSYCSPFHIVKGTFPTGALATSNFQNIDLAVDYASQALVSAPNDYDIALAPSALNPTTNVSRTGNTFMAVIMPLDFTNSAPNESASATDTTITFSSANNATPADRPTLTLNYILRASLPNYI